MVNGGLGVGANGVSQRAHRIFITASSQDKQLIPRLGLGLDRCGGAHSQARAISASIRLSARRFENQKFPHGSFSVATDIIAETRTGLRLIRMRRSRMRVSSVSFDPGIHRPLWAASRDPN